MPARWASGSLRYRGQRNPKHRRYRRNPNGQRGGMGVGTLVLLGVGGFLLLQSGVLGRVMSGGSPAAVPAGFVPVGQGLYRGPNGMTYARDPSSGRMIAAPPGGTPTSAEDLLLRAGIVLIPQATSTLANMVQGWFRGGSATVPAPWPGPSSGALLPSTQSQPSVGMIPIPPLPPMTPTLGWPLTSTTALNPDAELYWLPDVPTPPHVAPTDTTWMNETIPGYNGTLVDVAPSPATAEIDWSQYDWSLYDWSSYDWGPVAVAYPDISIPDTTSYDWGTWSWPDWSWSEPSTPDVDWGSWDWGGFTGFGRLRPRAFAKYGRRPASYR